MKRKTFICKIIAVLSIMTLTLTSCSNSGGEVSTGKQTLNVFTLRTPLDNPIMEFTNYNPHWRIEMEDIDFDAPVSDGIKKLNTEIFSGNGPDIIIMDEMNAEKYIEAGLLEDITDIVESAKGISDEIIEDQRVDGSIYTMPMGFRLILNSEAPGLGINFDSFSKFIETAGKPECKLDTWFPYSSGIWYRTELSGEINEKGEIDKEQLKSFYENLIQLYNYSGADPATSYYLYENSSTNTMETYRYFDTERFMLSDEGLSEINVARDYIGRIVSMQVAYLFQRDGLLELSFYEDEKGYGYVPTYIMAVNKNAKNKEAALECLKYMLNEGQEYMLRAQMLPVNLDYLTEKIRESSSEELNMQTVEKMTDEEKEEFIKVVSNLGKPIVTDSYAMEIVMLGAHEYLLGNEDIDAACDKTMNKLDIYFSEG